MTARFDYFVVFAEMRTGSNLLEASLNAFEGLSCRGELFNPHFVGGPSKGAVLGFDQAARDADPGALLAAVAGQRAAQGVLTGFRFFHDHEPRVLEAILKDPRCAKIFLTRNPLESYVSLKIAQATGQWRLRSAASRVEAKAQFDAAEFRDHLAATQAFQARLRQAMQTQGQVGYWIDYRELNTLAVINGLACWLGLESQLDSQVQSLKPQNPGSVLDKVENPQEMQAALADLDRFGLSELPSFEPARGPSVPRYVASDAVPALFLPLPGAPDQPIQSWLQAVSAAGGSDGLSRGFSQKTLRHWRAAHEGYRSFTVLRHPLLRAYVAYGALVEAFAAGERMALTKGFDPALLAAVAAGSLAREPEVCRAGFVAFLKLLKSYVSGQLNAKGTADWSSQTQILAAISEVEMPDLVLREADLAAGLAFLAPEHGRAAWDAMVATGPSGTGPSGTGPTATGAEAHPFLVPLAELYGPDLEKLCRSCYKRDYIGFGFGDWQPLRIPL